MEFIATRSVPASGPGDMGAFGAWEREHRAPADDIRAMRDALRDGALDFSAFEMAS